MKDQLFISVIVPVFNGGEFLNQCLDALSASDYPAYEIIVVDDGSTDNSAEISRQKGATVLQMPRRSGPAAARNFGAEKAHGEILFFVDADVIVRNDTMARVAADLQLNPDIGAVFGSYDESPAGRNFLSQYKNLYHHFVHQQSSTIAVTFWAGCGAIRRDVFISVGGYDQRRYSKPSIEDIELGYRMRAAGHSIFLDKDIQVKHLKQWKLGSLLRADIFYRAIPWSDLILENQNLVNDLNLRTADRISAGLVGLSLLLLPVAIFKIAVLPIILIFLTVIFILNYKLYSFFITRRGLLFAALAFPMQLLYFFYSGLVFVLCWLRHHFIERRPALPGTPS